MALLSILRDRQFTPHFIGIANSNPSGSRPPGGPTRTEPPPRLGGDGPASHIAPTIFELVDHAC